MKVEAEIREMYKITVGDDGVCRGCYDLMDEWHESYYVDTIKEIAELLNVIYYHGLPKEFYIEKYKVLIYEDKRFDYEEIVDKKDLKEEYDEFYSLWNSEEYKNIRQRKLDIDKEKQERERKIAEIKANEEKEKEELAEYLKLKEKYGNN
jgi:hypothetical protein